VVVEVAGASDVPAGAVVVVTAARSSGPVHRAVASATTTITSQRRREVGDRSTTCDNTSMRRRFVACLLALAAFTPGSACSSRSGVGAKPTAAAFTPGAVLPPGAPSAAADREAAPAPPVVPDAMVVRSPRGIVVPVLGREGSEWKISTPCGREAVIASATPVPTGAVVLDPGHGGYDPGAVGPNGLAESVLNLAVSKHAAAALDAAGFPTVLTHADDYGMNLTNRALVAVDLHAKAFVSIHHNGGAWAPSAIPGSEAYHQVDSPQSKRLSGLVYEEVVAALSRYHVKWVTSGVGVTWRTRANGEDWYAMVRQPKGVAAALEELAFITNPAEATLLAEPDVQRVEGEAVARGIIRFLTTADPGSGYVDGGPMPPRPRTGPRGSGDDACDDPPL
jgi:N-acetylmuramoyl-L-alanine amidase